MGGSWLISSEGDGDTPRNPNDYPDLYLSRRSYTVFLLNYF